ncbi:hypothetical protein BCR44DRAFT_23399 [Catenaria anguillulae PL171]|uniref:Uncharacterized protein n=1 Tax=Catenaria anguillulae PL171 TaxID=765915 RepID=A0A1Y2H8A9_9FUNG|nr:hypothetical protein BCR44DRAFT_23399 [Catenaria anguillulae PL171]
MSPKNKLEESVKSLFDSLVQDLEQNENTKSNAVQIQKEIKKCKRMTNVLANIKNPKTALYQAIPFSILKTSPEGQKYIDMLKILGAPIDTEPKEQSVEDIINQDNLITKLSSELQQELNIDVNNFDLTRDAPILMRQVSRFMQQKLESGQIDQTQLYNEAVTTISQLQQNKEIQKAMNNPDILSAIMPTFE